MFIVQCILLFVSLITLILGYLVGIKCKSNLINGYGENGEKYKYPIEIEKAYCRHIGVPIIILGILIAILAIFLGNNFTVFPILFLFFIILLYMIIVPNFVVKKMLNKIDED